MLTECANTHTSRDTIVTTMHIQTHITSALAWRKLLFSMQTKNERKFKKILMADNDLFCRFANNVSNIHVLLSNVYTLKCCLLHTHTFFLLFNKFSYTKQIIIIFIIQNNDTYTHTHSIVSIKFMASPFFGSWSWFELWSLIYEKLSFKNVHIPFFQVIL